MELERAHEILGLAPGASAEEIESACRQVRDDVDARLGRVRSAALRSHYTRLRQLIEPARDAALAELALERMRAAEPNGDALGTLGLAPGASALDVASAYVSSCEELERELAGSPVEAVRRACLAARAEIDAAYQRCAAHPLRDAEAVDAAAAPYRTQLADAPFEVARGPAAASEARASARTRAISRAARQRRRLLRGVAAVALLAGLGGAGAALIRTRLPQEWTAVLGRFARVGPPPELLEAHNTAEYLRSRVGEERRELQTRVEENRARVTRLEEEWTAARDPADYDRMAVEIGRARQRAELTEEIAALSETYVFESAEVAEAYGKIELGTELRTSGDLEEATEAFEAAWLGLEQALGRLDLAEEAVGARSEAQAALEAWEGLARSSGLAESEASRAGREVFEKGRALLEQGAFAEAMPELRGAARHFNAAIDDGRRRIAEGEAPQPQDAPAAPPVAAPPPARPEAAPAAAPTAPAHEPASEGGSARLADSEPR
jgi:hypothetical protein